jgi:hypothetical protein
MNLAKIIVKEGSTEPPPSQVPAGKEEEGQITKKDGPTAKALGW